MCGTASLLTVGAIVPKETNAVSALAPDGVGSLGCLWTPVSVLDPLHGMVHICFKLNAYLVLGICAI